MFSHDLPFWNIKINLFSRLPLFFPLNFIDRNVKTKKKKIDDDKIKMLEQKNSRGKLFLYEQIFS